MTDSGGQWAGEMNWPPTGATPAVLPPAGNGPTVSPRAGTESPTPTSTGTVPPAGPSLATAPAAAPDVAQTFTVAQTSAAASPVLPVQPAPPLHDQLLLRLFSARALALGSQRHDRLIGWIGVALLAVVAALIRLVRLGEPHELVFDETYYVKDGWTLWNLGFEARWPEDPNPAFESGDVYSYISEPAFVVHPQVAKWLIGLGIHLGGGPTDAFAWRIANAVVGILAVVLMARIARRLFSSTAMGLVAGGLMAVDGTAIVHSRTGLLDQYLMFFALVAFGCLLIDRDHAQRRLAARLADARVVEPALPDRVVEPALTSASVETPAGHESQEPAASSLHNALWMYGPGLGFRPWRLAAAVSLGLAIGVKWSGLYFLAGFGLMTVLWDVTARRRAGIQRWFLGGLAKDGVRAFLFMVPTAVAVYVGSWWSWFATPGAYGRQWAADNPGQGITWLPEALRSFLHYHHDMWNFHTSLEAEHPYAANPLGWIIQWRPTSFFWERVTNHEACGPEQCAQAITSLGNPILWWLGAASILLVAVLGIWRRDWRGLAVLSGIIAGWLPWMAYMHRTVFTFYSIAFAPWVILTLTFVGVLGLEVFDDDPAVEPGRHGGEEAAYRVVEPGRHGGEEPAYRVVEPGSHGLPSVETTVQATVPSPRWPRRLVIVAIAVVVTLIVVVSAMFYPIWSAIPIPFSQWQGLMWLPSWI
ncbi:MAG: phospholipid carrier-dependent glycosyltransferase [Cellulomonadaceae bacterium]|nr:phospholipid carrier-dependent glycosyltransferase [Cellulomonadaceae bacterium]